MTAQYHFRFNGREVGTFHLSAKSLTAAMKDAYAYAGDEPFIWMGSREWVLCHGGEPGIAVYPPEIRRSKKRHTKERRAHMRKLEAKANGNQEDQTS